MTEPARGPATPDCFRKMALVVLVFAVAIAIPNYSHAQTFTLLHTFTGGNDGALPVSSLTLDRAGNLYSTAYGGGVNNPAGTVFKLTHAGSGWLLNPLYEFSTTGNGGEKPLGGVVFGPDGALYGTASAGGLGFGTVYKLQPPQSACKTALCYWTQTVLYRFSGTDGNTPSGNLMFDQAGNICGTTQAGGAFNYGTVYKLTNSGGHWTESVLYSFMNLMDGSQPTDGVVMDSAGNLYGTTPYGGINNCQNGCGLVFELSPSGSGWTKQDLYQFQGLPDAQRPYAGLIIDSAGNLYGASYEGGQNSGGTVFQLSPSGGGWNYAVLYNLQGSQNGPYARLTRDAAGNLFGTTIIPSTIFELTPSGGGWVYNQLHEFSGNDGMNPRGSVTLDGQGNLYGTASIGGADSEGTAWELAP